jgi:DtxR family Mn-dependent transcriptional regulator
MAETLLTPLSESVQMYLVTIVRLRTDGQPVPLSELAEALSISPVSVNEMCRKMQDQGLLVYRPYKGATLTEDGERRAIHILRRHRLWEVFLVEKLGLSYEQAHEAACELEHSTSDLVADGLDVFLGRPAVNPHGEPIPRTDGDLSTRTLVSLTALSAGQRGHVVQCELPEASRAFLEAQGVRPGVSLTSMGIARDSILVQVEGKHLSLARDLADEIRLYVEEAGEEDSSTLPQSFPINENNEEGLQMQAKADTASRQIPLGRLSAGKRGVVVRVGGEGPVRRRMMDMGLVPGTEVQVVRVAPLGDPIEFTVKGYSLSLREAEAREIIVEMMD